jgi:ubiquinone/menaquinone biosynthesis C-methylase UbiE
MTTPTEMDDFGYYAETYDESVPDWPGEMAFYTGFAEVANKKGQSLLELACGTGRVIIRLAQSGLKVVGLDLSEKMLAVARQKGAGMDNILWVQGDMRSFELGQQFGLVLIPGQAFHNLCTPADQAACLESIHRHLLPDGKFVLHLDPPDMAWLGELVRDKGGQFDLEKQIRHPKTGRRVNHYQAWWYEPSTQSAITQIRWEELDEADQVVRCVDSRKDRLHSLFPFEVEHLFARTGFSIEAVYGDFYGHPLEDKSPQMVWVAGKKAN